MMKRQTGFTLIEMLVAMAIFSALITVLMVGYHQGLMLWQKGQKQSHLWLDDEFRYRLLDTMMTQAVVATDIYAQGVIAPYFKGSPYALRLTTRASLMDTSAYVRQVNLQFDKKSDGGWQLLYRQGSRYSDPGRGLQKEGDWVVLLDHLSAVGFQFEAGINPMPVALQSFDLTAAQKLVYRDKATWLNDFDAYVLGMYPQRVQMHFTDAKGNHHAWVFVMPSRSDAWSMYVYSSE